MRFSINSYAPVMIPTLNRFVHLKRCVESLSRCVLADKTELYIGLDFPPSDKYTKGYELIKEYITTSNSWGFKEVHIIERGKNYGADRNWHELIEYVYQFSETIICTEDDNVFSPCFLEYMNLFLNKYKDSEIVYSVCGYNFPVDMSYIHSDYYFNNLYSAWGVGRWRNKEVSQNMDSVDKILFSPIKMTRIYINNPKYILSMLRMKENGCFLGDLFNCAYSIAEGKLNIFPVISKVKNMGHDGSGVNSTIVDADKYNKQIIDDSEDFNPTEEPIIRLKYQKLDEYLDISWFEKIKIIVKVLLFWTKSLKQYHINKK